MYTLLKPIIIRQELLSRGLKIFTIKEFKRLFELSDSKAKYFLEKETKSGFLLRLKKGLYCLKTDIPSGEEIANRLYQPSYLSLEYALSRFNILPETTYALTSITTKPTRDFAVEGMNFFYSTIKKQAFTGYKMIRHSDKVFLLADPEKAMTDYLYFVSLGKKTFNDRLISESLDKNKMRMYAQLFNRKKLFKLLDLL
jgi:predicted transcriptional regulator of viral defense system